jgi:hypothetical protein
MCELLVDVGGVDGTRARSQRPKDSAACRRTAIPSRTKRSEGVGGVDGTRTRGLRRDSQEAVTAHHSRPRKIGVGSSARSPAHAERGRLFRNILQVLARAGTLGSDKRTALTRVTLSGVQNPPVLLESHAFQACLIDRSSISPLLESTSYERLRTDYRTRRGRCGR